MLQILLSSEEKIENMKMESGFARLTLGEDVFQHFTFLPATRK